MRSLIGRIAGPDGYRGPAPNLSGSFHPALTKGRVTAAYQAPSRAIARELAEGVVRDYAKGLPSAVRCFEDDFEACIAHLRTPINHRRAIRTTNLLERLFLEERGASRCSPMRSASALSSSSCSPP